MSEQPTETDEQIERFEPLIEWEGREWMQYPVIVMDPADDGEWDLRYSDHLARVQADRQEIEKLREKARDHIATVNDLLRQRDAAQKDQIEIREALGCTEEDDNYIGALRKLARSNLDLRAENARLTAALSNAAETIDGLRYTDQERTATIRRLNRRCQKAESELAKERRAPKGVDAWASTERQREAAERDRQMQAVANEAARERN